MALTCRLSKAPCSVGWYSASFHSVGTKRNLKSYTFYNSVGAHIRLILLIRVSRSQIACTVGCPLSRRWAPPLPHLDPGCKSTESTDFCFKDWTQTAMQVNNTWPPFIAWRGMWDLHSGKQIADRLSKCSLSSGIPKQCGFGVHLGRSSKSSPKWI